MKNILLFIGIVFFKSISLAQLPIKLTYFNCKSIDVDKIEVGFNTLSEVNVSIYEVYDGDKLIQSIAPKNTTNNTYKFMYKPDVDKGVLKLISVDLDGTNSIFYSKYLLPKKYEQFYKYSYDGKYLGISILENFELGYLYINSARLVIKK